MSSVASGAGEAGAAAEPLRVAAVVVVVLVMVMAGRRAAPFLCFFNLTFPLKPAAPGS